MSRYRRAMQQARRRESERTPSATLTPRHPPHGIDAGQVGDNDDWKIQAVAEVSLRCLLCGGPEFVRLFFSPDDQRRVQAPEGKSRLLRYSLCARCHKDPTALRRAEERLFAGVAAMERVN